MKSQRLGSSTSRRAKSPDLVSLRQWRAEARKRTPFVAAGYDAGYLDSRRDLLIGVRRRLDDAIENFVAHPAWFKARAPAWKPIDRGDVKRLVCCVLRSVGIFP